LNKYARDLFNAGLSRINISLDTLNKIRFNWITCGGNIMDVFSGIDAARKLNFFPIKINVVVMRGINDDEIMDFVAWGEKEILNIRFIEFMHLSREDYFYPLKPVMDKLVRDKKLVSVKVPGSGPAKSFRPKDKSNIIGFILSRSEPFCKECNRLRLTSSGVLLPCLFSRDGIDLKKALREEGDVESLFHQAVSLKPEKHNLNSVENYQYMNRIGG